MPSRDAILCNDCSPLFNNEAKVEIDDPFSHTAYITVPPSHRLHLILASTDPVLAAGSQNECHFCSLLARMRSRSNRVGWEDGSDFMSSSQTQDIRLNFYNFSTDFYHTIDIRKGKGRRSRNVLQHGGMILFKPTGMSSAADFNICLPWWHISTP